MDYADRIMIGLGIKVEKDVHFQKPYTYVHEKSTNFFLKKVYNPKIIVNKLCLRIIDL